MSNRGNFNIAIAILEKINDWKMNNQKMKTWIANVTTIAIAVDGSAITIERKKSKEAKKYDVTCFMSIQIDMEICITKHQ